MTNWIKTTDDLPKENQWCLCYGKSLNLTNGYVIQSWMNHTNKDYEWFLNTFSHWQPLPELPEE